MLFKAQPLFAGNLTTFFILPDDEKEKKPVKTFKYKEHVLNIYDEYQDYVYDNIEIIFIDHVMTFYPEDEE